MKRHRWTVSRPRVGEPLWHCERCGATKRGKGDKLQFILPYRKNADGLPLGWTPAASFTPPCLGGVRAFEVTDSTVLRSR